MAHSKPIVTDWEKIFLDSSILINLLLYQKGSKDAVYICVHKLITFLSGTKQKDGKSNRKFYVSTISLSEVIDNESEDMVLTIINLINSNNVEFIAYDDEIAKSISKDISHHITKASLHKFAEEIGWKKHELILAREWINRDFMIAMSGKNRNVDVHLTTDRRTYHPICDKIDTFCALCHPDLFDTGGTAFFNYHTHKVEAFINSFNKPKKKIEKRLEKKK